MKKSGQPLGKKGESVATDYLKERGYVILETNFRFERGEIDIVAKEGDVIVFIEVKTRMTKGFGDPEEAVTAKKQKQIWKVAEGFLYKSNLSDSECRFDVIAVEFDGNRPTVRHTQDAF